MLEALGTGTGVDVVDWVDVTLEEVCATASPVIVIIMIVAAAASKYRIISYSPESYPRAEITALPFADMVSITMRPQVRKLLSRVRTDAVVTAQASGPVFGGRMPGWRSEARCR
jgi:hypothetical protein